MNKFLFLLLAFALLTLARAWGKGIISVQQYQRLNEPGSSHISDNWVGYDFHLEKKKKRWKSKVDASTRFYTENEEVLYSLPEAYIQYEREGAQYGVGRKILDWTPNERFWSLGALNANRAFSHLEKDQEGIMGAHIMQPMGDFSLKLFASAIHIPQVNPSYKIKNGEAIGQTEWAPIVPSKVRYNDGEAPIYYELQEPTAQEILFHESLGLNLSYNWSRNGYASLYSTYKPENAIRLNATGYYEQKDVERARVTAKPFINHHLVYGTDIYQRYKRFHFNGGLMFIDPQTGKDENFEFGALKIEPAYFNENYAHFSSYYKSSYFTFGVNFLELINNVNIEDNVFGKRPRWERAVGVETSYAVTDKLSALLDYKYDLETQDMVFTTEGQYRLTKSIYTKIGLSIIEAPKDNSFWGPFRTNDNVYTNLSYHF